MRPAESVLARNLIEHRNFTFAAMDGYPLAARLWLQSEGEPPAIIAVINSGAGIAFGYYERFAQFLAANGVPTLIYDYRGIGQSRPRSLRGFAASVEEWGSKDCAAALEWLASSFPAARRAVIGHSVGGFVTGFVTNGHRIDQMLLVGAHTGYWRDYAARPRLQMYLLWHVLMPAVTRAVGYFPGRKLHLLEDLPAGVALEWGNRRRPEFWWNVTLPDGTPDLAKIENAIRCFQAVHAPTLAIRFTDDSFATEAATERVLRLYQNCPATRLVITPADVGGQKIGHFGFFRSRFRDILWGRVLERLRAQDISG